jgi:hypothetical protein
MEGRRRGMKARSVFVILALALVLGGALGTDAGAQPAQLQGKGLRIKQLTSGTPGKVMALVEADGPISTEIGATPKPDSFTLWVDSGAGMDLTVSRNDKRGKPFSAIFLVDESGSYKPTYKSTGMTVIRAVARTMGAQDNLGLLLFSTTASPYPVRVGATQFDADLVNAEARPAGGDTNLLTGLTNAIDAAAKIGDPGARDVVLLSDAGDEAVITEAQWNDVAAKALAASVRVHVVVQVARPKNIPVERYLDILNRLEALATATGGVYDKSGDASRASTVLTQAFTAQKGWLVVEAGMCGMKQRATAQIRVEYVTAGTRKAWSAAKELSASAWAPSAAVSCPSLCSGNCAAWEECIGGVCAARSCGAGETCPGGASCVAGRCEKACSPACDSWQQCKSGACAAKTCAGDEQCGAGASCVSGACQLTPQSFFKKNLVWILVGIAALLLLGGFFLLRKKPEPPAEVAPEPVVAAPTPSPDPQPKMVDGPDLDALPEVHLEAIGGWPTPNERWRIYKRNMQVGGSKDPSDGNDIVFDLPKISSKHAKFQLYPSGDLWLTDMGSANGTFLNGQKINANQRVKIKPGDQIKLSKALTLRIVKPGFDSGLDEPAAETETPSATTPAAAEPADAAPAPKQKKKTTFDPGNR